MIVSIAISTCPNDTFAFAHLTGIGNYNFVTPYSHELTHGLLAAVIAVATLVRFRDHGRRALLPLAGLALGLVFLTKAEVFLAVLGGGLLDEWIFVRFFPGELASNRKLTTFQLRAYRDRVLEERIRRPFEDAVARHAHTAITERQAGMDGVLASYPARRLA